MPPIFWFPADTDRPGEIRCQPPLRFRKGRYAPPEGTSSLIVMPKNVELWDEIRKVETVARRRLVYLEVIPIPSTQETCEFGGPDSSKLERVRQI